MLLLGGVLLLTACEEDLGKEGDGADFQGESPNDHETGDDSKETGSDACSMLDPASCPEGSACVRSAFGDSACQDHATIPVGESCFDTGDEICVAGALCFGAHANGSLCTALCDMEAPACEVGTCEPWFMNKNQDIGRCVP